MSWGVLASWKQINTGDHHLRFPVYLNFWLRCSSSDPDYASAFKVQSRSPSAIVQWRFHRSSSRGSWQFSMALPVVFILFLDNWQKASDLRILMLAKNIGSSETMAPFAPRLSLADARLYSLCVWFSHICDLSYGSRLAPSTNKSYWNNS